MCWLYNYIFRWTRRQALSVLNLIIPGRKSNRRVPISPKVLVVLEISTIHNVLVFVARGRMDEGDQPANITKIAAYEHIPRCCSG
jgi:hypothetical protein